MRDLRLPMSPARRLLLGAALLLLAALALTGLRSVAPAQAGTAAKPAKPLRASRSSSAHAAATYMTGIGDETTEMFGDPNWKQLHTRIARYIVPYDVAVHSYSLDRAKLWMKAAESQHVQVLDAENISPTLSYISEFKREIGNLRTVMPKIWGLHNYSDINRLQSFRTRELSRALGGQVWLTETGGIVQFAGAFPNRNGSGLGRAAKVLGYMFNVAGSQTQIKRLYIYDWTGGTARTRFDAGLTDSRHIPRPGYLVVCKKLHGAKCNVKTSRR